jgi:hypothetical protein
VATHPAQFIAGVSTSRMLLCTSIILFLASLGEPVLYLAGARRLPWGYGLDALLFGWFGFLDDAASMSGWCANITMLLGWIFAWRRMPRTAGAMAAVAIVLMIQFHAKHTIMLRDERGVVERIAEFGAGYWLWLASAVVLGFAACALAGWGIRGGQRPADPKSSPPSNDGLEGQ